MSEPSSAMQQRPVLPQSVTPLKLVGQGTTLTGVVPSKRLGRLAELVVSIDEPVAANLEFYADESGYPVVRGNVTTLVCVVCQRCLQAMPQKVSAEVAWIIVVDEDQIKSLPKRYEPWLLDDSESDLHRIIEEELLLALPIVSYHPLDQCEGHETFSTGEMVGEVDRKPSPFDVLQELKLKS